MTIKQLIEICMRFITKHKRLIGIVILACFSLLSWPISVLLSNITTRYFDTLIPYEIARMTNFAMGIRVACLIGTIYWLQETKKT
jgi:sensor histidine kinase YesM